MPKTTKRLPVDQHDHIDGCLCDVELHDHEIVADENLPHSKGGVEKKLSRSKSKARDLDDRDGCDLDFNADSPTNDDDLPAAVGGVD